MKKALSMLIAAVVMAMLFCFSPAVYAAAENVSITYDTNSSGTGWSYDSSSCTLILDGTADLGNISFNCKYKPNLEFIINLTGDTCNVQGISFSSDSSYCIKCTITSSNNSTLNVTGIYDGIYGSGVNGDIVTFDGVTVNTTSLSIGASGGEDSYIKLQNGANVTVNSSTILSDIYLSGNSKLTINGDCALNIGNYQNLWGTFSLEEGCEIDLNGSTYALGRESESGNGSLYSFLKYCPTGSQILSKETDYGTRPVMCDSSGNILTSLTLSNPPQESSVQKGSAEVKAVYSDESATVYSVDVSWGSMEFTYSEGTKEWDEKTHSYTYENSEWTYDEESNEVTVTNRSNAKVNVSAEYTSETGYEELEFSFKKASFELESADKDYIATYDTFELNPPTSFPSTISTDDLTEKKVGLVTITIDEADEVS